MIRILLVDDRAMMHQSLKAQFNTQPDLQVIGQAENGKCALEQLKTLAPFLDIVLIHISGTNEIEVIQSLYQQFPQLKILVLTSFSHIQSVKQTLRFGVKGYLTQDTPIEDMVEAIRAIHKGYTCFEPGILEQILPEVERTEPCQFSDPVSDLLPELMKLTARERSVLKLIATGANNREIAQTLFLTEGTVRNYISNILGQLNLRDRTQAAILANTFGSMILN